MKQLFVVTEKRSRAWNPGKQRNTRTMDRTRYAGARSVNSIGILEIKDIQPWTILLESERKSPTPSALYH